LFANSVKRPRRRHGRDPTFNNPDLAAARLPTPGRCTAKHRSPTSPCRAIPTSAGEDPRSGALE